MTFKLEIDSVPEPLWGRNLRADEALGDYRWRKLRKSILDLRGKSCAICRKVDEIPHGHEVWKYEETTTTGIARLVKVEMICRDCHGIHHWGLMTKLFAQGALTMDRIDELADHFCRVNQCKLKEFKRHMKEAQAIFKRRNALEWAVDWGPYSREVQTSLNDRAANERIREERRIDQNKTYEERVFDGDGPPPKRRKKSKASK